MKKKENITYTSLCKQPDDNESKHKIRYSVRGIILWIFQPGSFITVDRSVQKRKALIQTF